MDESLNILIISTCDPTHSANLGGDIKDALTQAGHNVDFVCRYSNSSLDNKNYRVLEQQRPSLKIVIKTFLNKIGIFDIYTRFRKLKRKKKKGLVYVNESLPAVSPDRLIKFIGQNNQYDVIITLFWFDMMNTTTLRRLYEVYRCPILIYSVDMAPMTGGCYYFNECRNFITGCGNCPFLESILKKDQSFVNYNIKKMNYSKINKAFLGNSWMNSFAEQSGLFSKKEIFNVSIILNEQFFKPINQEIIREKLGIQKNKIVLMARSWNLERKRPDYLINAISKLWNNINNYERSQLEVITIGDDYIYHILSQKGISIRNFGKVDREQLRNLYQAADLFLSPSTDDAGPSMVNQSIMCGTPVVSFNIGTAMDVIEEGVSGFKTNLISSEGFELLLNKAYRQIRNNLCPNIRTTTRDMGLKYCSSKSFSSSIETIYNRLTQG